MYTFRLWYLVSFGRGIYNQFIYNSFFVKSNTPFNSDLFSCLTFVCNGIIKLPNQIWQPVFKDLTKNKIIQLIFFHCEVARTYIYPYHRYNHICTSEEKINLCQVAHPRIQRMHQECTLLSLDVVYVDLFIGNVYNFRL